MCVELYLARHVEDYEVFFCERVESVGKKIEVFEEESIAPLKSAMSTVLRSSIIRLTQSNI